LHNPPRKEDLLLVAAGKVVNVFISDAELDAQQVHEVEKLSRSTVLIDNKAGPENMKILQQDIKCHAMVKDEETNCGTSNCGNIGKAAAKTLRQRLI
jgi:hypothetical protein